MSLEIYPVIHLQDEDNALEVAGRQAELAFEEGVSGVYLTDNHSFISRQLIETFNYISTQNPEAFIGLNFLNHATAFEAFEELLQLHGADKLVRMPNALWTDTAHNVPEKTQRLREENEEIRDILYLGGIAFKGTTRHTEDPQEAASEAQMFAPFVDVVTTSGPGTGRPTHTAKIRAMKAAVPDKPLAVASGVTAENLGLFLDADQILVSTSIETHPQSGVFSHAKLRALMKSIPVTH